MSFSLGFLVAIILVIYGLFLKGKRGNYCSPDVFYCLLWGVICFFSSFRLYGLWEASSAAYHLIAFGSMSFLFGTNLSYRFSVRKEVFFQLYSPKKEIDERLFFGLIVVFFVSALPDLLISIKLLKMGLNLTQLRHVYFGISQVDGVENKSQIVLLFRMFLGSLKIIIIASSLNMFFKSGGKLRFIIPITCLVILDAFCSGGRFAFVYYLIELVACYNVYKKYIGCTKKIDYFVKVFSLVPLLMVVIISSLRSIMESGSETESLLKHLYFYLGGSVVLFDRYLTNLCGNDFYSFSFAGLYGLWFQFIPKLNHFGVVETPYLYEKTMTDVMGTQPHVLIGDDILFNAFVTPFYHLYADLGYLGVFLGMFFWGFVAQFVYKESIMKQKSQSIVIYLMFMQFIFSGIHHYPGVSIEIVNSILFYILIVYFRIRVV